VAREFIEELRAEAERRGHGEQHSGLQVMLQDLVLLMEYVGDLRAQVADLEGRIMDLEAELEKKGT